MIMEERKIIKSGECGEKKISTRRPRKKLTLLVLPVARFWRNHVLGHAMLVLSTLPLSKN